MIYGKLRDSFKDSNFGEIHVTVDENGNYTNEIQVPLKNGMIASIRVEMVSTPEDIPDEDPPDVDWK